MAKGGLQPFSDEFLAEVNGAASSNALALEQHRKDALDEFVKNAPPEMVAEFQRLKELEEAQGVAQVLGVVDMTTVLATFGDNPKIPSGKYKLSAYFSKAGKFLRLGLEKEKCQH